MKVRMRFLEGYPMREIDIEEKTYQELKALGVEIENVENG
jgi:hypothetical protein